jgi:hypothetical protein
LARLALGSQELGVSIRTDGSDFAVRFCRELHRGLLDPWAPRALSTVLLPDIPSIDQDSLVKEMAKLSGFSEPELDKITRRPMSTEKLLVRLMCNAESIDALRQRVRAKFESAYFATLDEAADAIFTWICVRLEDNLWFAERRRMKSKAKRRAATASAPTGVA